MLRKILSGGQTGVDRAALDAAIEMGIPHGGWVPRGRRAEDGTVPETYDLQETRGTGYPERTEKNVKDSDGTLILSQGELRGGSALTRDLAGRLGRPCMHIDIRKTDTFEAVMKIKAWIRHHGVKSLNVAGPRLSQDPDIYVRAKAVLRTLFQVMILESEMPDPGRSAPDLPITVDEAVEHLIARLSLKQRSRIANIAETGDIALFRDSMANYIRLRFKLPGGNQRLMESCRARSREGDFQDEHAVDVIVLSLWERLRGTHRLRRIK